MSSMHVPPLLQGFDAQSFISERESRKDGLIRFNNGVCMWMCVILLTLMTVCASESWLAGTGEVSSRLADAAPVRTTHI